MHDLKKLLTLAANALPMGAGAGVVASGLLASYRHGYRHGYRQHGSTSLALQAIASDAAVTMAATAVAGDPDADDWLGRRSGERLRRALGLVWGALRLVLAGRPVYWRRRRRGSRRRPGGRTARAGASAADERGGAATVSGRRSVSSPPAGDSSWQGASPQ